MKEKKSNTKKLIAVLAVLAVGWLAVGTFGIMKYRDYMYNSPDKNVEVADKSDQDSEADEEKINPGFDAGEDQDDDVESDRDSDSDEMDTSDDDQDQADDDNDEADDDEEKNDTAEDEKDEDDDEEEKDYVVMKVQAPDNFAAVRTGRGTQFQEVGRITNGHRVALKELENGWYEIARGKYKGYYVHQSSFVAD